MSLPQQPHRPLSRRLTEQLLFGVQSVKLECQVVVCTFRISWLSSAAPLKRQYLIPNVSFPSPPPPVS